jgi:uncharacterized protein (TIGR02231 family)
MKQLTMIAILLLAGATAFPQIDKPVDSKITRVTVFLNRAQVTRVVKTRVEAGKTNLVLTGLTAQLDHQSVQVSGKGNFVILGIQHNQNYLSDFNKPKKLQVLQDSLEIYKRQLALEQHQKDILNKEEQLILSNQKIGGSNQNLSVNELKAMADFYRTRLNEIGIGKIKSDDKIKKINERIAKINQQIREQSDLYNRNTSEIVVSVSAEASTSAELEVNYVVANAGWYPVYDIRAINTKNPVQLNYKANVFQSTGEEWNNVRLKLSTANPSLGGVKPELYSWFLDFYQPVVRAMQGRAPGVMTKARPEAAPVADEAMAMSTAQGVAAYVETVQTTLNTEFDISLPYTVLSASKPTMVDIQNHEMKATYQFAATPKLDQDAFLLAKAIGWEEFSLLPGEANVFFEGTFVGKTYIDPNTIKDTLAVSLGRDKRIVVKREKVKDFTTRRAIGSNLREAYAWEITVRNTRNEVVKISVEDQVPVSKNSQIEVTVLDVAGAKYNKETGKLVWDMDLQPNESRKIVFKYEVKYPKDKQVSGL